MGAVNESSQGDNTWIDPETKTHWLRDLLPQELPAARILSYDYNSSVVLEESPAGIERQASNLLNYLKLERQGDTTTRPIIFIAHSFGGIVVKSALASAYHGDGTHAMTWVFTYGILFLGVPHRGTSQASWGRVATDILRIYTETRDISFLKSIKRASAYNDSIKEAFRPLLGAYIYCSVGETIAEPPHKSAVVNEKSAILGQPDWQECKIFLARNHTGICRFHGSNDSEFGKVMEPLRIAAKAATSSFDYSPTQEVRSGMLGSVASLLERTEEDVSSSQPAERYINLVLANINDIEQDINTIQTKIEEQNAIIDGLLRWFHPFAALLLGVSFFGASPGARTLMLKHKQGLQAQKRFVELQREAIAVLDDRRSSALRAIRILQSARGQRPASIDPTAEAPFPPQEVLVEEPGTKIISRVEWIVRELQGRNHRLLDAERDLKEAEEFKEATQGKSDKEILVLAKERLKKARSETTASGYDKRGRECVIL